MLRRRQPQDPDVYFATTRAATRKTLVSCIGVRECGTGATVNFAVTPLPVLLRPLATHLLQSAGCRPTSRIRGSHTTTTIAPRDWRSVGASRHACALTAGCACATLARVGAVLPASHATVGLHAPPAFTRASLAPPCPLSCGGSRLIAALAKRWSLVMCGRAAQVSDGTNFTRHLHAVAAASVSKVLYLRDMLRLLPAQGDSSQATRLGVVPGVVPWRRGCEQPAFSDCATGEELADECWFGVRRSSSVSRACFLVSRLCNARTTEAT